MNILLKEFIKAGGAPIGGDYRIDQVNSMTTSPATPQTTTDDYVKSTRQGSSRFLYRTHTREEDSENINVDLPKKDKSKLHKKKSIPFDDEDDTTDVFPNGTSDWRKLKEGSRIKMDELVDDVFTKKDFDRDILNRGTSSQTTMNGIPDIERIKETNPILLRKVSALKDIIEKNNATGEDKGIILNYLLSMDLTDIPTSYKNELKKKIR